MFVAYLEKRNVLHMEGPILTREEIAAMRAVSLKEVKKEELRDIQEVEVRGELPRQERLADFVRQIGNPYCYRHGDYVIKTSFADTEVTLEERLISYIRFKD
ncbi:MAG: hypothetical protein NC400_06265 [Clostridium sp.]|nr:hypothetical protein [Clostridium sp.]